MRVIVPFDAEAPKTRLAPVLDPDERATFARVVLGDVLAALRGADRDPEVYATAPVDVDAPVTVDDRALDPLVGSLAAEGPLAVVMADLALATPTAIDRLFAPDADLVFAPGRGGGTNAIVARHTEFRPDYHGVSIRDHRRIADDIGASLAEVDSFRLATDVDDPEDLPEVLLHGEGSAADWLRDRGFELDAGDGRVTAQRRE